MAITVTLETIKETCPTTLPDAVISGLICTTTERIAGCLEMSYPECTAELLLTYAVCHFVQAAAGGDKKMTKAPNGASTTLEIYGGGEGLSSTPMGRLLVSLDTKGCANSLTQNTFLFGTVGNTAEPRFYE